ncbi:hypothetical protein [Baekduia sp. Peel2402]|uniref:hypothetical protein n=1 Tax=Baekduia sp. Peel2402 TaxID=3458296 RepID=UPI00403EAACA
MSRTWVLCALAAVGTALPVAGGHAASAEGSKAPAPSATTSDKGKSDKDDKKDEGGKQGKDPAPPAPAPPTAAVPAPAPAPAPDDHPGTKKDKNKGKGKDDGKSGASTTAPAPTAAPVPPPAPAPAPAAPGASATPTVALDTATLTPTLGQSVGVVAAKGTVKVRTADGRDVVALSAASAIPTGARIDARAGTVELTTAVAPGAPVQTATFSGAVFAVKQDAATGLTRIALKGGDFSRCRSTRRVGVHAAAAKRRKPVRSLWGKDDNGRFETRGKGAVGTVRGTRWLTQDFCDGTLTRVVEGTVAVRDLRTHRTIVVRAGHSYFARY